MKKLFYFYWLIGLLLVGCTHNPASDELSPAVPPDEATTTVSPAKATAVAALFCAEQSPQGKTTPKTVSSIRPIFASDGTPSMFVINYVGGGFVVVSATKEYYPILAYSDENSFALDPDNGGLMGWVEATKFAAAHSEALPDSTQARIGFLWSLYDPLPSAADASASKATGDQSSAFYARIRELRNSHYGYNFYSLAQCTPDMFPPNSYAYQDLCTKADNCGSPREYTIVAIKNETDYFDDILPLVKTTWGQRNGYNTLCPQTYPAGCMAVAMAQIMTYYRLPAKYNWNDMPSATPTPSTQQLIYDAGVAANTTYGPNGSSSNLTSAENAFLSVFGYRCEQKAHNGPTSISKYKTEGGLC